MDLHAERRKPVVRALDAAERAAAAANSEAVEARQLSLQQIEGRGMLRACRKVVRVALDASVVMQPMMEVLVVARVRDHRRRTSAPPLHLNLVVADLLWCPQDCQPIGSGASGSG